MKKQKIIFEDVCDIRECTRQGREACLFCDRILCYTHSQINGLDMNLGGRSIGICPDDQQWHKIADLTDEYLKEYDRHRMEVFSK